MFVLMLSSDIVANLREKIQVVKKDELSSCVLDLTVEDQHMTNR